MFKNLKEKAMVQLVFFADVAKMYFKPLAVIFAFFGVCAEVLKIMVTVLAQVISRLP